MKRYCSQCGKMKTTYKAGQCKLCFTKWMKRKDELRKEGFYKNMDKLRQPRYFNFLREDQ
jgi:hypothetical protein